MSLSQRRAITDAHLQQSLTELRPSLFSSRQTLSGYWGKIRLPGGSRGSRPIDVLQRNDVKVVSKIERPEAWQPLLS